MSYEPNSKPEKARGWLLEARCSRKGNDGSKRDTEVYPALAP
jgi:hypothetical protein